VRCVVKSNHSRGLLMRKQVTPESCDRLRRANEIGFESEEGLCSIPCILMAVSSWLSFYCGSGKPLAWTISILLSLLLVGDGPRVHVLE
jgi:hypothetical protein